MSLVEIRDLTYHYRRWKRSNNYARYDIISNIIKEYSSYEEFFKSDDEETELDLPSVSGGVRVSIHEVYIFIFVMCLFL